MLVCCILLSRACEAWSQLFRNWPAFHLLFSGLWASFLVFGCFSQQREDWPTNVFQKTHLSCRKNPKQTAAPIHQYDFLSWSLTHNSDDSLPSSLFWKESSFLGWAVPQVPGRRVLHMCDFFFWCSPVSVASPWAVGPHSLAYRLFLSIYLFVCF